MDAYITQIGGRFTQSHRYFRKIVKYQASGKFSDGLMRDIYPAVAQEEGKTSAAVEKGSSRAALEIWDCEDCQSTLLEDLGRKAMDYPGPGGLASCIIEAVKVQAQKEVEKGEQVDWQAPVISRFYGVTVKMFPDQERRQLAAHLCVLYDDTVGVILVRDQKLLEGDLPPRATRMVREWVRLYREELLEIWDSREFRILLPLE